MKRRDQRADAPCGHGDLGQASQRGGLSQTHKRDERLFQEIHLADQNVGGFCITRNLLHEFIFQLWERRASVAVKRSIALVTCTLLIFFQEFQTVSKSSSFAIERCFFVLVFYISRKHVVVEWWWVLRLKDPHNLLMQLSESIQKTRSFTLTC